MGHSMGGGAALLATAYSGNITAALLLAAAETNPSAVDAATGFGGPALIFSGGKDRVTPPADHQIPMYNALPGTCKYRVTVTDGSHCQFSENSTICNIGERTVCLFCSFLDGETHRELVRELMAPWLDWQVKGSETAGQAYLTALAAETAAGRVSYQGQCP